MHNTLLPRAEIVFRLAGHTASDGSVSQTDFDFSTGDKEEASQTGDPQYLSVWSETLTEIKQALLLVSHSNFKWACKVRVLDIARIEIKGDGAPFHSLGVYWKRLDVLHPDKRIQLDSQPGRLGHAGIVGLYRPKSIPRTAFKLARKELHELARKGAVPLVPIQPQSP